MYIYTYTHTCHNDARHESDAFLMLLLLERLAYARKKRVCCNSEWKPVIANLLTPFTVAMSSCWLKPLPSAAIFVTRSKLVPLHWCCIHLVELISKKWSNTGASRSKPAAIGASAYAVFMQATATGSSVTIIRQSAAAVCNSLKLGWYLIAAASQRS